MPGNKPKQYHWQASDIACILMAILTIIVFVRYHEETIAFLNIMRDAVFG